MDSSPNSKTPKVSSNDLKLDITNKTNQGFPDYLPPLISLREVTPVSRTLPLQKPFKSSRCLPTNPIPSSPRKDDVFNKRTKTFITEGEGTENGSIGKIAEERVVTTSNIDRWKRTFQSLKSMLRKEEGEQEENSQEEIKMFYDRSRRLTVWTDEGQNEFEDIYEELTQRQIVRSFCIINPDSGYKAIWDVLVLLFTIVQALLIPFKLAFLFTPSIEWAAFEIFIDFYFMVDIMVCFNTGFYRDGVLLMNRKEIVVEYLKTWFLLDLLSTFPYSWVLDGCFGSLCNLDQQASESTSETQRYLSLLKMLRFLRVIRLLRVLKIRQMIFKFESGLASDSLHNLIRLVKLFVSIIFLAHWMACLFFYVSREDAEEEPTAWVLTTGTIDKSLYYQYVTCLYWAITTMITVGYGDITPSTANEKVCVMVCMLFSSVMFAYIVGSIGNLINRASEVEDKMRMQMVNINKFLAHRRIPKEVRNKIRKYLEYAMEEKQKLHMDEKELMGLLSTPLQDELNIYFHGSFLHKCPVFDDFPVDFLSYLTFFLQPEHFSIGDSIFEEDDSSSKMYFIVKGRVIIYQVLPLVVLSELSNDNSFGEIGLLGKKLRTAGAESLAFTQVLSLSSSGLEKAAAHFPIVLQQLGELADEINNGILNSLKLVCYFCHKPNHIAPNCPNSEEFVKTRNKQYKCELRISFDLKILRKKIMTNKMCERAQKRLRRSKCTANYDDSKESSRVSFMESPNESGFLKEEGMKTTPARKGTEIDSFSLAKKAFGENSKSILKKAGTIRPRNSKKTKRRVSTFLRIERLNAETNGKQEESITTRPKAEAVETFGNYIEKIERADHSTPRLGEDMEGKIVTRKKESVLNLSNWNKRIPIKRNQIMPLNQRMEENETERELIKYGKNGMK